MSATLNLHKVFAGPDGYLQRLRVSDADQTKLRDAKDAIRQALRDAFRDWNSYVTRAELFEGALLKASADPQLPRPKFRLQGSTAYFTLNDIQQHPPQQIDMDDGVFLPIGFLSGDGETHPGIASKAYFKLVEDALSPLCAANGWTLNPGRLKDSCVRIEIDPRMHIDLPLYAIRDDAFRRLHEATLAKADDGVELFESVYRGLGVSEIMLAHRSEEWWSSDPRKLEDWFSYAIEAYGPQVRRLARAFKGMRDAAWPKSKLSSICIMVALVKALENLGAQDDTRDDLALCAVAREMSIIFARAIENPVFPGDPTKNLCDGWPPEFRMEVQRLFLRAADELSAAINGTLNSAVALAHATTAFGARVPTDTKLISIVGLASAVRSVVPEVQPKPAPMRTKSG